MLAISSIRVAGPDAFEFLQGQLSNDLRRLESEDEIRAAWCNPKGRVIWFGTVRAVNGDYVLSAPAEVADEIARRLAMFRFRAQVEFEVVDEGQTVDPVALIEGGHAFIGRDQSEQFTPHMLNLDLLDAVSFDKGCYTGQEVVARTHYKGATKRRTLRFACSAAVAPGDKVQLEGRDVGTVLNAAGAECLAVVPIEHADAALTASGAELQRLAVPGLALPG